MKTVQRGNKQLRVTDDRLEDMLKSGYVEVDEKTGKPLRAPTRETDAAALKKENAALKRENKELREQLEALKRENKELREQLEALKTPVQADPSQG